MLIPVIIYSLVFIWMILRNSSKNALRSQATLIVDKLHLHLLPSMNPDGFAAVPKPKRNNAHDIDLNRDFPDQVHLSIERFLFPVFNFLILFISVPAGPYIFFDGLLLQRLLNRAFLRYQMLDSHVDTHWFNAHGQFFPGNNFEEKRQVETRAVMKWIRSTRFTASATLHEVMTNCNFSSSKKWCPVQPVHHDSYNSTTVVVVELFRTFLIVGTLFTDTISYYYGYHVFRLGILTMIELLTGGTCS